MTDLMTSPAAKADAKPLGALGRCPPRPGPLTGRLSLAAAILLVLAWLAVMARYTADAPYHDDFDQILASVVDLSQASGPVDFIRHLFQQHNEDRPAVVRALAWLDYKMFGRLNFAHLALAGNLLLALTVAGVLAASRAPLPSALPLAMLVFTLQAYETATFATASLQYHGLLVTAVMAMLCAWRPGPWLGPCIAILYVALVTHIGALALHLAVAALLAVRGQYRRLAVLVVALAPLYLLFFHGYAFPSLPAEPARIPSSLVKIAVFIVNFSGNAMGALYLYNPALWFVPAAAGLAVLAGASYFVAVKPIFRQNPTLWGLLVFLLLLGVETSLGRYDLGLRQAFSPRYSLYSALLVGILFICGGEAFPGWTGRGVFKAVLPGIALFSLSASLLHFPALSDKHARQVGEQRRADKAAVKPHYPKAGRSKALHLLDKGETLGIYTFKR